MLLLQEPDTEQPYNLDGMTRIETVIDTNGESIE